MPMFAGPGQGPPWGMPSFLDQLQGRGNPTIDILRSIAGGLGASAGRLGPMRSGIEDMGAPPPAEPGSSFNIQNFGDVLGGSSSAAAPALAPKPSPLGPTTAIPPSFVGQAYEQGGPEAIRPTVDIVSKMADMGPPEPGALKRSLSWDFSDTESPNARGTGGSFEDSDQGLGESALEFAKNALTLPLAVGASLLQGGPMNVLQRTVGSVLRGGDPGFVTQGQMFRQTAEMNLQRQQALKDYWMRRLEREAPEEYAAIQPVLSGPLGSVQKIGAEQTTATGRKGISSLGDILTRHPWMPELTTVSYRDQQLADVHAAMAANSEAKSISSIIDMARRAPGERVEAFKAQALATKAGYDAQSAAHKADPRMHQLDLQAKEALIASRNRANTPGGGAPPSAEQQLRERVNADALQAYEQGGPESAKGVLSTLKPSAASKGVQNPWLDATRKLTVGKHIESLPFEEAQRYVEQSGVPGSVVPAPSEWLRMESLQGPKPLFIPGQEETSSSQETAADIKAAYQRREITKEQAKQRLKAIGFAGSL